MPQPLEAEGRSIARRRVALLFWSCLLLYSITSQGNLPGDSRIRWSVSRQIVRNGSVALEDSVTSRNYAVGKDGKHYSLWGPGQSLLMVPFAAVGLGLEKSAVVNPTTADMVAQFLTAVLLFPAIGAFCVLFLYYLCRELECDEHVSLFICCIYAFATMAWHYGVTANEQSQIALLLILACIIFLRNVKAPSFRTALGMCATLGAGLLVRPDFLIIAGPVLLFTAGCELSGSIAQKARAAVIKKWLFAGIVALVPFLVMIALYNFARFGNIFENGNFAAGDRITAGRGLFSSPPVPTLLAILLSPGKSLLLYNPILILLPLCVLGFYRRNRSFALMAGVVVAANLVFYSFYITWTGDYAWGGRFQMPLLSLLVIPLGELMRRMWRWLGRFALCTLLGISVLMQFSSMVYNVHLEFLQNSNHSLIPDEYVWDWKQSHLLKRIENIGLHIAGRPDYSVVPVTDPEPRLLKTSATEKQVQDSYYVNFYPFKARAVGLKDELWQPLLALWMLQIALLGFLAYRMKPWVLARTLCNRSHMQQEK